MKISSSSFSSDCFLLLEESKKQSDEKGIDDEAG